MRAWTSRVSVTNVVSPVPTITWFMFGAAIVNAKQRNEDAAARRIRANSVAARPVWTPLIPSTMPEDTVESFAEQAPLGRLGQAAELAPVYVLLASDESSCISGARIAVTGGRPVL